MGETANKLTTLQIYLLTTNQPCHSVTDKYNGLHFTEFVKRFRKLNVMYPYKNDKTQFLIELHENDCVITCEMVNNICVNGYIFKNE